MLSLTLLPLLFVTAGFAAPSSRDAIKVPASALSLPANQTQLVAPTNAPSLVTVAVRSQNYSCSSEGTWLWVVVALSFVHTD
jgi:hypothetical protein